MGRYRTVLSSPEEYPQLYDLSIDPAERRNLVTIYPEVATQLSERLQEVWATK